MRKRAILNNTQTNSSVKELGDTNNVQTVKGFIRFGKSQPSKQFKHSELMEDKEQYHVIDESTENMLFGCK